MNIRFEVRGIPAPQGSKRHVGKGVMIEQSKRVKPWRAAVKEAALIAMNKQSGFPLDEPINVQVIFTFQRPKSHLNAKGSLKPKSPIHHITHPDVDKLVRSTGDALVEAGMIKDDRLIFRLRASKHYGEFNGAFIELHTEE